VYCSFWRTLVVDPSSTAYYRWLGVISVAVLYNLLVIIARSVFWQLRDQGVVVWFVLDYTSDLVYLIDMFVQLRTGLTHHARVCGDFVAIYACTNRKPASYLALYKFFYITKPGTDPYSCGCSSWIGFTNWKV